MFPSAFGDFGVLSGLNQKVQCRTFTIHCSPQSIAFPANVYDHLIQIPMIAWGGTISSQVRGDLAIKFEKPTPNCFIRNVQARLDKEDFDITLTQSKSGIKPDRMDNQIRWKAVIGKRYLCINASYNSQLDAHTKLM